MNEDSVARASAIDAAPRRHRSRRAVIGFSIAGLVAAVVVLVLVLVLVRMSPLADVELRGQGPNDITVTYSSQIEQVTLQWPSEGRAEFNTEGDWAEIVITAPADSADQTVSCQIVWNGEVVVDETSDDGSVTCRYGEG